MFAHKRMSYPFLRCSFRSRNESGCLVSRGNGLWKERLLALVPLLILLVGLTVPSYPAVAVTEDTDTAWETLPRYEYGQDMAPLLAVDRAVIQAMGTPESRRACAARLARLLIEDDTTLPAKQYICLKLRQIGTPGQVPTLSQLLTDPETSEIARQTLQVIPGSEASEALRGALDQLSGRLLIGAINSVAARGDAQAVGRLKQLADSDDQKVAQAAVWGLGKIGGTQAVSFLVQRASQAKVPTPPHVAVPLLRSAHRLLRNGERAGAEAIFAQFAETQQAAGVRQAALEGLFHLAKDKPGVTVVSWLTDGDRGRRQVALGHLQSLSADQLDELLAHLAGLSYPGQMAVIELAASRRGKKVLPMVMSLLDEDNAELKTAGINCLGVIGDADAIPALLDMLAEPEPVSAAARNALLALPRKPVVSALLDALENRPGIRKPVIAALVELKCYDAIDPLIEIAARPDPASYGAALEGLRGIADPDRYDIPRLVNLLLETEPGKHQDEVEKTILLVTEKLPDDADRSKLVREALEYVPGSRAPKYLPVLGRLGGSAALRIIESNLVSRDDKVRAAAIRALCNWPNAEVADRLLRIAKSSEDKTFHRWALRAYVRVVTLESNRPPKKTLAMLQESMELARVIDDKRLVLERAATVRNMDAVNWIAGYLDDSQLCQTACRSIIELAHHRFLRHPNMKVFGPLLKKVSRVCKDAAVAERAERYRLGL